MPFIRVGAAGRRADPAKLDNPTHSELPFAEDVQFVWGFPHSQARCSRRNGWSNQWDPTLGWVHHALLPILTGLLKRYMLQPFETCCFFHLCIKGNHHSRGNVQVYNASGSLFNDKDLHSHGQIGLGVSPQELSFGVWSSSCGSWGERGLVLSSPGGFWELEKLKGVCRKGAKRPFSGRNCLGFFSPKCFPKQASEERGAVPFVRGEGRVNLREAFTQC